MTQVLIKINLALLATDIAVATVAAALNRKDREEVNEQTEA